MWRDCRKRYGGNGPFLFGAFSNADAMYAPVVARFHTYDIEVSAEASAYMTAMMALPAWKEWTAAALKEPWVLPEDEVDWPTVLKV
jgi:glutathione S-transferase